MITTRKILHGLGGCMLTIATLLLPSACSDDTELQPAGGGMQLLSATRSGSTTPLTTDGSSIRLYLTTPSGELTEYDFTYSGSDNSGTWSCPGGVSIREESQYYIYGYMLNNVISKDNVNTAAPTGGYANGIDMTMTGLPAVSDKEICMVVGVQHVAHSSDTKNVEEGSYGYFTGVAGENYLNLLADHLYSQLVVQYSVDASYSQLRTIKLKGVTLNSTINTVCVKVNIRNGKGVRDRSLVTFTPTGSTTQQESLFSSTDGEALAVAPSITQVTIDPTLRPDGKAVYCAPCIFSGDGSTLTITSTYDVYDKKNNLIRKDCESKNKIRLLASEMGSGIRRTLKLTVSPTYLYVLSDPDLDNPTVEIQ